MLSKQEAKTVEIFRTRRNELFHKLGIMVAVLSEAEQRKIFEEALRAVDVTDVLCGRVYDPKNSHMWTDPLLAPSEGKKAESIGGKKKRKP
ncbi:MAG: hypothetical protein WED04_04280 [Promethearchaeati archaeon SRVP18_Atabeyarchaeia-1]